MAQKNPSGNEKSLQDLDNQYKRLLEELKLKKKEGLSSAEHEDLEKLEVWEYRRSMKEEAAKFWEFPDWYPWSEREKYEYLLSCMFRHVQESRFWSLPDAKQFIRFRIDREKKWFASADGDLPDWLVKAEPPDPSTWVEPLDSEDHSPLEAPIFFDIGFLEFASEQSEEQGLELLTNPHLYSKSLQKKATDAAVEKAENKELRLKALLRNLSVHDKSLLDTSTDSLKRTAKILRGRGFNEYGDERYFQTKIKEALEKLSEEGPQRQQSK